MQLPVMAQKFPSAFLDTMVTVLAAKHDLQGAGKFRNSQAGSVYIVKPKIHGPEEVEAAVSLFEMVENVLGLEKEYPQNGYYGRGTTHHCEPERVHSSGE